MNSIELRQFAFGSEEYRSALHLRARVLREPLGLVFSAQDLAGEESDIHLGAFVGGVLIGCLYIRDSGHGVARMRQVAIAPEHQGAGIGGALVRFSEQASLAAGFSLIELHARQTAVAFYTRLGYEIYDDAFVEVGLAHRKMRKKL